MNGSEGGLRLPTALELFSVFRSDFKNREKSPKNQIFEYHTTADKVARKESVDNRTCKGPNDSDGGQAEILHAYVMATAAVSRVGRVAVSVQHRSLKIRSYT